MQIKFVFPNTHRITTMPVFHYSSPSEAQTRSRIVIAALRLFASRGFDSTTTRDLAHAAGVLS